MQRYGPDPHAVYPNEQIKQICYIKNVITRPNITVGDYTYYDDIDGPESFEKHVTHHYEFLGDRLIIGKFCAIARGVEFIMNGANHRMNTVTTYPFNIMGGGWEKSVPALSDLPFKGDTIIGNDVWIGQNVTILPGVHIGDGAIIAANSVVTKPVPPYTVAGGNPARSLKKRFDDELVEYLLELKWWDWPPEKIFTHLEVLCSADLELIKSIDR
jgi:virginiamycin A acetyltransferase